MSHLGKIIPFVSLLALVLNSGCATLPENIDRPESYALKDTEDTAWAQSRMKERAEHPGRNSSNGSWVKFHRNARCRLLPGWR